LSLLGLWRRCATALLQTVNSWASRKARDWLCSTMSLVLIGWCVAMTTAGDSYTAPALKLFPQTRKPFKWNVKKNSSCFGTEVYHRHLYVEFSVCLLVNCINVSSTAIFLCGHNWRIMCKAATARRSCHSCSLWRLLAISNFWWALSWQVSLTGRHCDKQTETY